MGGKAVGNVERRTSTAERRSSGSSKTPTIAQLLAVIAEYNRAHELDLAEAARGGITAGGKNEFLEELYFAAAKAAKALRPVMEVKLAAVADRTLQGDVQ